MPEAILRENASLVHIIFVKEKEKKKATCRKCISAENIDHSLKN